MKQPSAIERLVAAMDRCAVARGEAQWTNGYRTGKGETDGARKLLFSKEMRQWSEVESAERNFRRVAQRLFRERSE